jgi:hypothetical protein
MRSIAILAAVLCLSGVARAQDATRSVPTARTEVSIVGDAFHINGRPTYEGRTWQGHKIEGLLLNSRMVQGIFDDLNPDTVKNWAYPDTGKWDAERNTREFVAAMPSWRERGLLAFTINVQGGNPRGYGGDQPWHNSAFTPEGICAGVLPAAEADHRQGGRTGDGCDPRRILLWPGPAVGG